MLKKSLIKRVLKIVGIVLLIIVIALAGLLAYLTITEYKPEDVESLTVTGTASKTLSQEDSLTILTWNTGYASLDADSDCFLDGGSMVKAENEEQVQKNLQGIIESLEALNPDIIFLQEVDVDSARSRYVNQLEAYQEIEGYESSFALNYKANFVPYPIPPLGRVEAGIMTLSKYSTTSAERIQLPIPFSWPIRTINLKRCLDVSTIPVEGTDKNLILVNLHLEAYDDGEGKAAQTAQLREILEEAYANGDYVIAGGDFNQVFSNVDSEDYPILEGMWQPGIIDVTEFSSSWQFEMDASVPTCRSLDQPLSTAESTDPEEFQYYMIDGFIVSDNITINSLETKDLGFENTDHNPVLMSITLE